MFCKARWACSLSEVVRGLRGVSDMGDLFQNQAIL